jgi:hypothetical protein
MTSDRQISSNGINRRRSGGPRTAVGKASSRRNALQHGLSVSVLNEPAMCFEVEKLARAIAGAGADEAQLSQARIIAEAQFDLVRIQGAKGALMNSHMAELMSSRAVVPGEDVTLDSERGDARVEGDDSSVQGGCAPEFAIPPTIEIMRQLSRLERYECRAISRRRRAMRAFLVFSAK